MAGEPFGMGGVGIGENGGSSSVDRRPLAGADRRGRGALMPAVRLDASG
jgi:hypothetical protein